MYQHYALKMKINVPQRLIIPYYPELASSAVVIYAPVRNSHVINVSQPPTTNADPELSTVHSVQAAK